MVSVDINGQVATLTIDDVTALSRHSEGAGRALRDAIADCGDRDDLKVVLLRAGGADFCAPVAAPFGQPTAAWNELYAGSTGLYQTLCFSKKVTIASVTGECAGAGSLLTLCCDLAVASADARFHQPFDTLPEANFVLASLTVRLNRLKSWMLDGVPLTAQQAYAWGLINRIAVKDAAAEALVLAKQSARVPLDGIAMSKLMIESCLDAQGVGQDFDRAALHAASFPHQQTKAGGR